MSLDLLSLALTLRRTSSALGSAHAAQNAASIARDAGARVRLYRELYVHAQPAGGGTERSRLVACDGEPVPNSSMGLPRRFVKGQGTDGFVNVLYRGFVNPVCQCEP